MRTFLIIEFDKILESNYMSRLCAGKDAEIAVEQIRAISKQRLRDKLDVLSEDMAARLRRLITEMYGEI